MTDVEQEVARLSSLVSQLHEQGRYPEAVRFATEARDLSRQHLGERHPTFARTLDILGNLYRTMGDYAAAAPLLEQSLDLTRRTLGEQHPDFATTLNNMAMLYAAKEDYAAAIPLLEEAHRIVERALGKEHPHFARSLANLASLHLTTGDYATAEPLLRQALQLQKRVQGETHPDVAQTMETLGRLRLALGDHAEAQRLLEKALEMRRHTQGDQHPDVASTLSGLGQLHLEKGDHDRAMQEFREALKILRQTVGEDHPLALLLKQQLGVLHQLFGNLIMPPESEALGRGLGKRHDAPTAPAPGNATERLVGQQSRRLRRGRAPGRSRLRRPRPQPSAAGEGRLREVVAAIEQFNREGIELARQGRHEDAVTRVEQSRDLIQQLGAGVDPEFAQRLVAYAAEYSGVGNYAAAADLLEEGREILRRTLGKSAPEYAMSLNNLGHVHRQSGNFAASEPILIEALQVARAAFGERHLNVATTLNNLAGLYMAMGRFADAEPLYKQALAIRRQLLGAASPAVAESLDNLGGLFFQMGDFDSAQRHSEEALYIYVLALGEHHPDVATTLSNIAILRLTAGDLDGAEHYLQRALVIARALGDGNPAVARNLHLLAHVEHRRGNYVSTQSLHEEALVIERAALGSGHPIFASALYDLANVHREQGNYAAAEPLLREAQRIFLDKFGNRHPHLAMIDLMLGAVCAATGRDAETLELMNQAIAVQEKAIEQIFAIGSESQRLAHLMTTRVATSLCLSLLRRLPKDTAAARVAYDLLLRRKALVAETLAVQRDAVLGGKYPHLEPKLREMIGLRVRIGHTTLAGGPQNAAGYRERLLETWAARQAELEVELAHQIPEIGLEQKLQHADSQTVAAALPPRAALIEFVHYDAFDPRAIRARGESQWQPVRYMAFVLASDNASQLQMIDLGEAEAIDQKIASFRAAITGEAEKSRTAQEREDKRDAPRGDVDTDIGTDLRGALLDPILPALSGRTRLFVAPDGDLTRLPFEVLPLADGRRLIEEYEVSYLGVGRDLLRLQTSLPGHPGPSLVAADPDYDLAGGDSSEPTPGRTAAGPISNAGMWFSRLPETRLEGEQVAKLLGAPLPLEKSVRLLVENEVLEARLKAHRAPRVLHLATHGFFLHDQPRAPDEQLLGLAIAETAEPLNASRLENPLLRAGLALAGANTWLAGGAVPEEAEDGILTAEDVTGLDLLGTELVVLSACETGLGEVHAGEGVFGLRRSFVLAGARTVVMSLWKVPDRPTQELMEGFYRRLLAGEGRAAALRHTQLEMKSRYDNPLYWGAFICEGDPGPLPAAPQPSPRSGPPRSRP